MLIPTPSHAQPQAGIAEQLWAGGLADAREVEIPYGHNFTADGFDLSSGSWKRRAGT
jgi:hypothetical protein